MKFKAVWKPDCAQAVGQATATLLRESSAEKATIKLTPRKMYISSMAKRKDMSESWIELDTAKAFSTFICESLRDNLIDLAISASALILVSKYVASAVFCATRLTKRGTEPVLRFEFNFLDSGNCLVVHDVPVEVIRSEFAWMEPVLPDPEIRIFLDASLKRVSQYLDRLRLMGVNEVSVEIKQASSNADLFLEGTCDSVKAILNTSNHQIASPDHDYDTPDSATVQVSVSGIAYILTRALPTGPSCRSLFMISESKYASVWTQFPNFYGFIAAVTPGILAD